MRTTVLQDLGCSWSCHEKQTRACFRCAVGIHRQRMLILHQITAVSPLPPLCRAACVLSDVWYRRGAQALTVLQASTPACIQTELFRFDGCEHVKVDAVAAKGICFAKYVTANTAHLVMEAIHRADCKVCPCPPATPASPFPLYQCDSSGQCCPACYKAAGSTLKP